MKKITITASQKFENAKTQIESAHRFDKRIIVPGYDATTNEKVIFLQDTKYVMAPGGIKSVLMLCHSCSNDFIALYGPYYFVAGKKFAKLSHKQQLATIAAELMRNNLDIDFVETDLHISDDTIIERAGMNTSRINDGAADVVTPHEDASRKIVLAGLFGKKTANAVMHREINVAMKSAGAAATVVAKETKKEKAGYHKKEFKDELKAAKKENKAIMKVAKKADKDAKKAEKATAKADKATEVDLDNVAATIEVQPA